MIRSIAAALGLSLALALVVSTNAAADEHVAAATESGTVIFYRPSSFAGAAVRFNIHHAGRHIGQLLSGSKIELQVPPGEHHFTTSAPSLDGQDSITVFVEAGKTNYVKGNVRMGWPVGRPKFTLMSEGEAQSELAQIN